MAIKQFFISILIIWLLFCNLNVFSQNLSALNNTKDSLNKLLLNEQNIQNKATLYYNLAHTHLLLSNKNEAIDNALQSDNLAQSEKNYKLMIDNQLLLAHIYIKYNDIAYALQYYLNVISILEKQNNYESLTDLYTEIGLIYRDKAYYNKALEYFSKAMEFTEKTKDEQKAIQNTENMAYCYQKIGDLDNALNFYNVILKYYERKNRKPDETHTYLKIIDIYLIKKEYRKALEYNLILYDLVKDNTDKKIISDVLNNTAYLYVHLGEYNKALPVFKQNLIYDEQLPNNNDNIANTLTNMGLCYQNLGDYDNCLSNLRKALDLRENENLHKEQADLNNLIAMIFLHRNDLYNAEIYSKQAVLNAETSKNPETLQLCYRTYSRILQEQADYENALTYYQKYLSIRDSVVVEKRLSEQAKAEEIRKLENAEKEYRNKLIEAEFKDLAMRQLKLEAEKREREIELLRKNNELQEMEKHRALQSLVLAKQQHEAYLRNQQIKSLEQEQEISNLELKKKEAEEKERLNEIALLETEKEKQRLELDKQAEERKRVRYVISLFGLIFILILIGLMLVKKKNRKLKLQKSEIELKNSDLIIKNEEITAQKESLQRANEEISAQKESLQMAHEEILSINEELLLQKDEISVQKDIIQKKNQSITDSILYAKRIQQAIFPPADFMSRFNSEYFIFFKPRDIVSGDFYWFYAEENYLYLAAADCTGHGVPGAFMSMLGISLLNKIVGEQNILHPHLILNELRSQIKSSLHQTGKALENKDGMDISFCRIDLNTQMLEYSGANNPLYIVQNTTDLISDVNTMHRNINNKYLVLTEIKADKMPIGVYLKEKDSFTNHQVALTKGDTIYLFSDGYIDQFGGDTGRKFLAKTFKNLLLDINNLPLGNQQEIINETYLNWVGADHEQLDDIIVIGFKL